MHALLLTTEQWQAMQRHVEAEAPLEACGLIAGKDAQVESVLPIQNQAHSPTRYVMDPQEQLNAFEWIESNELDLLAIYHSHPGGPEALSMTDVEEAAYPVIYVVWSRTRGDWQAKAFRIEHEQVDEIQIQVV